jgi:hypothetical protein
MKTPRLLCALAALALPLVVGASGCHTYKYVDMSVSFDPAVDDTYILDIARCRILVSGADSADFVIGDCPNHAATNPHIGYSFEFSTFAESGTLNFEFKGFQGLQDTAACQIFDGTQAVPVTGMTTISSMMMVTKTGNPCANNVSDAGP